MTYKQKNRQNFWQKNQRVVVRTEPMLGVGIIEELCPKEGTINICFPLVHTSRQYSLANNSLQRFTLKIGESAQTASTNDSFTKIIIESIEEKSGLLIYFGQGQQIKEEDLDHQSQDSGCMEQFFAGLWTHHHTYDLRQKAWQIQQQIKNSSVCGLVGPKVMTLPHQLYVAKTVSQYPRPRVLLADEVGLGKTIEAGLIFSCLHALERAHRVLIITPESLKHQWLSEMFRRFDELFTLFDKDRYKEEKGEDSKDENSKDEDKTVDEKKIQQQKKQQQENNPFLSYQKILCSLDFLSDHPDAYKEALAGEWDLVIVDEAHHLKWDMVRPSLQWQLIKGLSQKTPGLLLLTATPQLDGLKSQFDLLNLVDPQCFSDFESFKKEAVYMKEIAQIAKSLFNEDGLNEGLSEEQMQFLKEKYPTDKEIQQLDDPNNRDSNDRDDKVKFKKQQFEKLLPILIDRHGTGRVFFRNRRERLKGFPKRTLVSYALEDTTPIEKTTVAKSDNSINTNVGPSKNKKSTQEIENIENALNTKLPWLKSWIESFAQKQPHKKVLILCSDKQSVLRTQKILQESLSFKTSGDAPAIFHEDLSIIERDQQAARFSEKTSVKALICSEIGGEGRNFQFVQDMVLLDLPRHPDVLEQRIGRLDRIGQKKEIFIHVPWVKKTGDHIFFEFYQNGLNCFESSWNGAGNLMTQLQKDIDALATFIKDSCFDDELKKLIDKTKHLALEERNRLKQSVDILVDMNSFNETTGRKHLETIEEAEDNTSLEFFIKELFAHYGVEYQDYDAFGTLLIRPSELMFIEDFPGLKKNTDTLFTFDRQIALKREDMVFLTQDHRITKEILNMLLDRNEGVASLCQWPNSPLGRGLLLEVSFVLEPMGPESLELNHFLSTQTQELQFNQNGEKISVIAHKQNPSLLKAFKKQDVPSGLFDSRSMIEPVVEKALNEINTWAAALLEQSIKKAQTNLHQEELRLEYLAQVNPNVTKEDVIQHQQKTKEILSCLKNSRPRLDAMRLIISG